MRQCPKCKREYRWDSWSSELRETITSEKRNAHKPACAYCQKREV